LLRIPSILLGVALVLSACTTQQSTSATAGSSPAKQPTQAARHDLSADEERGGHTLKKHVGKSDDELRARLQRERKISSSSTYTDRETAESTIARALENDAERVRSWSARRGNRPNLTIEFHGDVAHPVGRTMHRDDTVSQPCSNAVVVLKADGNSYYVLTSYPECR
jgi:toxin YxiD